jgi:hypothetical protein
MSTFHQLSEGKTCRLPASGAPCTGTGDGQAWSGDDAARAKTSSNEAGGRHMVPVSSGEIC